MNLISKLNMTSHMSDNLSETERDWYLKAVNTKGIEATSMIYLDWWYYYSKDPNNTIKDEYRKVMDDAFYKNISRVQKKLFKNKY